MKAEEIKINYRITDDGVYSNIEATYDKVDDYEVFSSYTMAKAKLIKASVDRKNDWVEAIKYQRSLKKSNALEYLKDENNI